jgi:xylulokinase
VLDVTGTWEIVLTSSLKPALTPEVQKAAMSVESHVARNTYVAWSSTVASDMLEWYRQEYGAEAKLRAQQEGGADWDYLIAMAEAASVGSRGVMFLPHLSSAYCPIVDPRSLGAFVGLSNFATKGDMLRAMIEGLDYQFRDIIEVLEKGLSVKADRIVAVGGAVRNKFWMQNKADVTGRPIDVPDVEEATPLGAALLAGIGVGLYRNEQDAFEHVYKPGVTYTPDPARVTQYAELFNIYRQLYPALMPISHQLYDRFLA